jgi:tetratricopeptide (TPR) repeat protein
MATRAYSLSPVTAVIIVGLALGMATVARAMDTTPSSPPAARGAGTLDDAEHKVAAGDYAGAIPILTAIVQKDPNNTDALNLMGYSLRKTGQTDLALQYYNRALALQPKHLGANEYLGELYAELGQIDKAKERLAVLRGACGDCVQSRELAAFIDKTAKRS